MTHEELRAELDVWIDRNITIQEAWLRNGYSPDSVSVTWLRGYTQALRDLEEIMQFCDDHECEEQQ